MKKYIMIILCSLLMFSVKGQQLGFGIETWGKITHEVKQLVLMNENIQYKLEGLLLCAIQDRFKKKSNEYNYFHLYIKGDTLEFRLSNYPYKCENLIGFFILREYYVFVHNELPDFLKPTEYKKRFSYMEHKLGDLIIMEDDTPCWIIEYKKSQLNLLRYPLKLYHPLIFIQ